METIATLPDGLTLEGAIVIVGFLALRQLCEIVAKQIPDSATGVMGGLRMLFRTLAMHITNKE